MRTARALNDVMEFDHVVRVHPDGTVTDEPNVWAPNLQDGELDNDRWDFFTHGYSGQHGYSGPIMHDSEYIGGGLGRDILATPGVYAAVASYYSPEGGDGDSEIEGWAVVRLKENADDALAIRAVEQWIGHLECDGVADDTDYAGEEWSQNHPTSFTTGGEVTECYSRDEDCPCGVTDREFFPAEREDA